jgi:hypothetical protein
MYSIIEQRSKVHMLSVLYYYICPPFKNALDQIHCIYVCVLKC